MNDRENPSHPDQSVHIKINALLKKMRKQQVDPHLRGTTRSLIAKISLTTGRAVACDGQR